MLPVKPGGQDRSLFAKTRCPFVVKLTELVCCWYKPDMEDRADKVFDPHYRGEYTDGRRHLPGLEPGLAICKRLVGLHQGANIGREQARQR